MKNLLIALLATIAVSCIVGLFMYFITINFWIGILGILAFLFFIYIFISLESI